MPRLKPFLAALVLALTATFATLAHAAGAAPPVPQQLHRGINVLGSDPIWTHPSRARFQARHFDAIRAGGFDFIRVNLAAFRHMDSNNRLEPQWLERLDWVVHEATRAGLKVILDEHDFNVCSSHVDLCRTRMTAFWQQVAPRYRDAPPGVIFELLNEPHDKLDAAAWNALLSDLLVVVRHTNPTRTIVIGPTHWNAMSELSSLRLPENDRNILVTFHYYEPFRFTHQGAAWTDLKGLSGVTWGSDADRAQLVADFAKVADWARANDRPILLGEFGAYDKNGTPIELRTAYAGALSREAEREGFAWAYWQFDGDFIAWDMSRDQWVEPIHHALIPEPR